MVSFWTSLEVVPMPTLTLKNIPDDLYRELKEAAKAHRRSMNSEILSCVETTIGTRKIDVTRHLATARSLRIKTEKHPVTEDELTVVKNEGRR